MSQITKILYFLSYKRNDLKGHLMFKSEFTKSIFLFGNMQLFKSNKMLQFDIEREMQSTRERRDIDENLIA